MVAMHVLRFRNGLLALALAAILTPASIVGQVRDIVSKQVSVGRSEAALRIEFRNSDDFEISFEDGEVRVDGEFVGSFEPGDALEASWRSLLAQAVALDDGELSIALSDWRVPGDLAGELAEIAQEIDRALEQAVTEADLEIQSEDGSFSLSIGDESSLFGLLLKSTSRLGLLEQALDGLDDSDFRVHLEEDVVVPEGTVVEGTMVVVRGNVRIDGEVRGDVVVVDGTVEIQEDGRVRGEVRLADARVVRNLGDIDGGVVDVLDDDRDRDRALRDSLRDEIREEFRSELRSELRNVTREGFRGDDEGFSLLSPFRPVVRGVGGLIESLFGILLLGMIGAAAVAFFGENVDAISETARRSPGRSAMVGLAGSLLLLPVWILGAVALAVSIIGIPVAIAWLPLFPLAAAAAAVLGYLAVARNAGEWLADSEYPWTGWIRKSNPIYTIFGGLAGLSLAYMVADVVSIAPFLGFLQGLLALVGTVITFLAIQIGFGAVLLTRAGRRREYWPMDPDEAWAAAVDVEIEVDAPMASEKTTTGVDEEEAPNA